MNMEILEFQTVDSLPALYHPEADLLVVSDLHLGLEGSVTHEGNYVPQFQLEQIKEDVRKASDRTGASRILLNGDLKHEFKYTRFSEKREIEEFVDLLHSLFDEVVVVEGNHDTFLEEVLEDVRYEETHLEHGLLFMHGHEALKPDVEYDTLVIGHEHPALELKDDVGTTEKIDCFLYGKMKNGKSIVVMPAFSKISGGSAVNNVPQSKLLSPVLRNEVELGKLHAVGVDREAGILDFTAIKHL
jgi:putative SbcD/Mre11-related phosphoesterase